MTEAVDVRRDVSALVDRVRRLLELPLGTSAARSRDSATARSSNDADRVMREHAPGTRRVLVGLAGPPGAGKTTLAGRVAAALAETGTAAVVVPMDGFHLADRVLDRLRLLDRKGAAETFDGYGYAALLRRLRAEVDHAVYAPAFERDIEQPIAGAIEVPAGTRVVLTEGNYLLDPADPWPVVRGLLDEVWYCGLGEATRRSRLIARHVEFGKAPAVARAWVEAVDEPNARQVEASRARADLEVLCG